MSNAINKKRPPKLKLEATNNQVAQQSTTNSESSSSNNLTQHSPNKCSTSDIIENHGLDSKVWINIDDEGDELESNSNSISSTKQQGILICPKNLDVIEQLGRGQYGIVEKVRHQASGKLFAVKRVELGGSELEGTKLLMDVDILVKGTKCKNIIKFYGALLWEGNLWILMELMDCSLDKFYRLAHGNANKLPNANIKVKSNILEPCTHLNEQIFIGRCDVCNPIPENVLGRMTADIINALSYLYSIKVIHRDIKPSNILINHLGVIKLCDFGISGYLINSVAKTYEAGCRPYMAPERIDPSRQGSGRDGYDIKSDVWSLGITMFEIATGSYPYSQIRDLFAQIKAICIEAPPRLPRGRFSEAFEDFINQCLRKEYQKRPKYDALGMHPFILANHNLEIKQFTERVLSSPTAFKTVA